MGIVGADPLRRRPLDSRLRTALRMIAALGPVLAPAVAAQPTLAQSAYGQASTPPSYPPPASPQPAYAQPGPADALRTAPYAGSGQSVRYGGMQAYDRYGGETRHPLPNTASSGSGAASGFTGRLLSWSGRADGPAPPARPASYTGVLTRGPFAPPIGQLQQAQPAPGSIYASPPPMAQAAPRVQAPKAGGDSQAGSGPRLYSVHRDYGIEPDPIPLPPQFFGATADLSQPATSDPSRRTAGGKAQNPLQPSDGQ